MPPWEEEDGIYGIMVGLKVLFSRRPKFCDVNSWVTLSHAETRSCVYVYLCVCICISICVRVYV